MTWFNFVWQGKQLRINDLLRKAIDTAIYNTKYNPKGKWDIMILVTGDRRVGTGKSTITQLMAAYWSFRTGVPYTITDVYWDSQDMINKALKKPDYHINHYDEARRGLVTNKRMSKIQEDLLDYYAECRQLHHINFIVLPDFFKLNEEIAVSRSEYLVNVVRERKEIMTDVVTGTPEPTTEWTRGTFHFWRWESKKILYDIFQNTRKKDYWSFPPDFHGDFEEHNILDKTLYEDAKRKALMKYQEDKKKSSKSDKFKVQRNALIKYLKEKKIKSEDIADIIGATTRGINFILDNDTENNEFELDNED